MVEFVCKLFKYLNFILSRLRQKLHRYKYVVIRTLCAIIHMIHYKNNSGESLRLITYNEKENARIGFISTKELDLSIIIPVYNGERYIEECLESVLSQNSLYSFEIIVVNDGSNDRTGEILSHYEKDSHVKIINQENAGQSAARNNALLYSRGGYIMFLDCDDILLPFAIDLLMNAAIKYDSDVVEGDYVKFYNRITSEMIMESKTRFHIESNGISPEFVLTSSGYSWAKLYRRELWENLRFPEGYIFEDIITKFILRRISNKVVYIGEVVYGYRISYSSSSHTGKSQKYVSSVQVLPKVIGLCKTNHVPMDGVFYLLCLNHIGLLNRVTTKNQSEDIQRICFEEMQVQLKQIQDTRPKKLPFYFRLLEYTILNSDFFGWKMVADLILDYSLLPKWREIN